ncbi:hypothetical protein SAMN04488065_0276 [Haloplanus vescus]|uniref:Uncharacterized protein n=1 Tax=Haloplanus vescus TaxID=555874 RepID=A0A1H3VU73_9EURY|nr:hypothetical protein [Haloplanus vescus]SDZ78327.1 hypothetical protein SAMN04488065_0276 [Haloplanus vescus]
MMVAGVGSLSGCSMGNVDDITVRNETECEITGEITVTRVDDSKQLLDDTFTLAPVEGVLRGTKKQYSNVVGAETARVHVTIRDGPEGTHEFTDSADSRGLDVEVHPDAIEFDVVVS